MKFPTQIKLPSSIFRATVAAALAVLAAAPVRADTLADMKAARVVVAGYANTAPFSYLDADGKLTGQAIDLARAAFKNMGVGELKGVLIDFPGLIPALKAKQFDVIAASMAIRPARCQQILFSDPYSAQPLLFVYREGVKGTFTDFKTLAASGARFAALTGSVEAGLAKEAGVKSVIEFPDLASSRDGLRVGRADVIVTIPISVKDTMEALGKGFVQGAPFAPLVNGKPTVNFQAFGFRPGDEALRDAFNAEVAKLRKSGELARIFKPFGISQGDIDLGAKYTAKELCQE